jgi:hypothetical protein
MLIFRLRHTNNILGGGNISVPKRRFARELMVEVSEELNEYFKKHPDELKSIFEQVHGKIREFDKQVLMYKDIAATAKKDLDMVVEKYETLSAMKSNGMSNFTLDSINIPKDLFKWCANRQIKPNLILLYGIILDCRLDALANKQLDSNGVVYITHDDIDKKCASLGMPEFAYRNSLYEPLPIELLEELFLVFIDDSRIYIRVLPPNKIYESFANPSKYLFI